MTGCLRGRWLASPRGTGRARMASKEVRDVVHGLITLKPHEWRVVANVVGSRKKLCTSPENKARP